MKADPLKPDQRLKRFREHMQASQRELAKVFGVSPGALAMWENGAREISGPGLILLERLEQEFGITDSLTIEPALDADHLSRQFSEKILMEHPATLRPALKELIDNYLSRVSGTRQLQVGIIEKILDSIANTKGVALKIIQLASFLDFGLSDETRARLVQAQNASSPMTSKQLKDIFLEEFGKLPEEIFTEWNANPIATASIGQVHAAVLQDGTKVAVKVQYPHIYRKMVLQTEIFKQLSLLVSLVRNDYSEMLKDFVKKLRDECDYQVEASHQEAFYNIYKDDPDIRIPKVFRRFSTGRILTTEFMDGQDFQAFKSLAPQDKKDRAGGIIHRFNYESGMKHGLIQTDGHPGNYIFLENQVAFLDFGRIVPIHFQDLERMKSFHYAIHTNNPEAAKNEMQISGYVRRWKDFNFDEFWSVIRTQMDYELSPKATKFTREYMNRILRLANSFKQRGHLTMNPLYFWPVFSSLSLWGIFAELEAEYPWRENVHRILLNNGNEL